MSPKETPWRERAYNAYVSSGQAGKPDIAPRAPYIRAVIAAHIPPNPTTRILDLGCGHGAFLYLLKTAGYIHLRGVDVSAEQVALAHELGVPEVEQGEIDPFLTEAAPGSFDVILMMDVLEHLTRSELFATLDGVYRALAPGGLLIAHVPNAEGLYGARVRYGDITHEAAFTPRSAGQVCRVVGFAGVSAYEDKPLTHNLRGVARRALWELGTLPHRLLLTAETGHTRFVLSQNMLFTAHKPTEAS